MPQIKFVHEDGEGNEIEDFLPARWEICDRCHGTGGRDPDAFSNGFSMEELHEDPDFAEAYFQGFYDVPCDCQHGKVMVVDEDRCPKDLLEKYYHKLDWEYNYKKEREKEIRMGY
jgi:hypothetical protein